MSKVNRKMLTDVELELMGILWERGEGSVAQVQEMLPAKRKLAYTSVSTILRILEQKEILKSRKEGRGHVYVPLLKKSEYEKRALHHIVDRVFRGTPVDLVKRLLGTGSLNESDLEQIKQLIREKERA